MRQKEKDSKQKENLTAKRKRLAAKFIRYQEDYNSYFFAVRLWLFFLLWGYSFCREVFPFALKVNSFAVTVVGHRTFEILFPKILDFSTCGYSWEQARTLLIWLAFKPYNSWTGPFRKRWTFLYVRQVSENKAFTFCNCCSPVVRGEDWEHDLISSPVSTFSVRSA